MWRWPRSNLSSSVTSRSAIRTLQRPVCPDAADISSEDLCYGGNIGRAAHGTTGRANAYAAPAANLTARGQRNGLGCPDARAQAPEQMRDFRGGNRFAEQESLDLHTPFG